MAGIWKCNEARECDESDWGPPKRKHGEIPKDFKSKLRKRLITDAECIPQTDYSGIPGISLEEADVDPAAHVWAGEARDSLRQQISRTLSIRQTSNLPILCKNCIQQFWLTHRGHTNRLGRLWVMVGVEVRMERLLILSR